MAESSTLTCLRVGFTGELADTPEDALTQLLRRVEGNGYTIVSVSVLRAVRSPERYEAYIVTREGRYDTPGDDDRAEKADGPRDPA